MNNDNHISVNKNLLSFSEAAALCIRGIEAPGSWIYKNFLKGLDDVPIGCGMDVLGALFVGPLFGAVLGPVESLHRGIPELFKMAKAVATGKSRKYFGQDEPPWRQDIVKEQRQMRIFSLTTLGVCAASSVAITVTCAATGYFQIPNAAPPFITAMGGSFIPGAIAGTLFSAGVYTSLAAFAASKVLTSPLSAAYAIAHARNPNIPTFDKILDEKALSGKRKLKNLYHKIRGRKAEGLAP